jgi:hypothetical protein
MQYHNKTRTEAEPLQEILPILCKGKLVVTRTCSMRLYRYTYGYERVKNRKKEEEDRHTGDSPE